MSHYKNFVWYVRIVRMHLFLYECAILPTEMGKPTSQGSIEQERINLKHFYRNFQLDCIVAFEIWRVFFGAPCSYLKSYSRYFSLLFKHYLAHLSTENDRIERKNGTSVEENVRRKQAVPADFERRIRILRNNVCKNELNICMLSCNTISKVLWRHGKYLLPYSLQFSAPFNFRPL